MAPCKAVMDNKTGRDLLSLVDLPPTRRASTFVVGYFGSRPILEAPNHRTPVISAIDRISGGAVKYQGVAKIIKRLYLVFHVEEGLEKMRRKLATISLPTCDACDALNMVRVHWLSELPCPAEPKKGGDGEGAPSGTQLTLRDSFAIPLAVVISTDSFIISGCMTQALLEAIIGEADARLEEKTCVLYAVSSRQSVKAASTFHRAGRTNFYDAIMGFLTHAKLFEPLSSWLAKWVGDSGGAEAEMKVRQILADIKDSDRGSIDGRRVKFIKQSLTAWSLCRSDVVEDNRQLGFAQIVLVVQGRWSFTAGMLASPGDVYGRGGEILYSPHQDPAMLRDGTGPGLLLRLHFRFPHLPAGLARVLTTTGQSPTVRSHGNRAAGLDLTRGLPVVCSGMFDEGTPPAGLLPPPKKVDFAALVYEAEQLYTARRSGKMRSRSIRRQFTKPTKEIIPTMRHQPKFYLYTSLPHVAIIRDGEKSITITVRGVWFWKGSTWEARPSLIVVDEVDTGGRVGVGVYCLKPVLRAGEYVGPLMSYIRKKEEEVGELENFRLPKRARFETQFKLHPGQTPAWFKEYCYLVYPLSSQQDFPAYNSGMHFVNAPDGLGDEANLWLEHDADVFIWSDVHRHDQLLLDYYDVEEGRQDRKRSLGLMDDDDGGDGDDGVGGSSHGGGGEGKSGKKRATLGEMGQG